MSRSDVILWWISFASVSVTPYNVEQLSSRQNITKDDGDFKTLLFEV